MNTDTETVRVVIAGAAGRMGRRLAALIHEDPGFELAAAVEHPGHEHLGVDSGELAGVGRNDVPIRDDTDADFDVLIDFSTPSGTLHWIDHCLQRMRPFITGVTGFGALHLETMERASRKIPLLVAPNMSPGVNLMLRLVREAAGVLGDDDVEIVEAHHRFKRDAPSGTAGALLDAVRAGRGTPAAEVVHGREGAALDRPAGQIGMHSLRGGDIVGEHEVILTGLGETLTIRHRAHSRDIFARGALRAATWIKGRLPGMYSMQDVLFDVEE